MSAVETLGTCAVALRGRAVNGVAAGLLLLVVCVSTAAADTEYQAGIIEGRTYNQALQRWFPASLEIWAFNNGKFRSLSFLAATGIGPARVSVNYDEALQSSLEESLAKALEWSHIAVTNKADVNKLAGCFSAPAYITRQDVSFSCSESGVAAKVGEIGLRFFSGDRGKEVGLAVSLVDARNQFLKQTVYLDVRGINALLAAVKAVPATMERSLQAKENEQLFK